MNKKTIELLERMSYSELEDLKKKIEERQSNTYRRYLITFEVIFQSHIKSSCDDSDNALLELESFCDCFPEVIQDVYLGPNDTITVLHSNETWESEEVTENE